MARTGAEQKPTANDALKPTFTSVRSNPSIEQNLPTGDYPPVQVNPPAATPVENDPYADLDFGDFEPTDSVAPSTATADISTASTSAATPVISSPLSAAAATPAQAPPADATAAAGVLDWAGPGSVGADAVIDASPSAAPWGGPVAVEPPVAQPVVTPVAAAVTEAAQTAAPEPVTQPEPQSAMPPVAAEPPVVPTADSAAEASSWGNLDSIPTPKGAPSEPAAWGKLDDIPTPAASGGAAPRGGLGASMMGKARAGAGAGLLKNRLGSTVPPPSQAAPPPPPSEPAPVLDDVAAQKKLDQLMSSSNETSDYIFATGGLDARMLGRIDGWVSQIEAKDKYADGHARQVAEISCAIAKELGLDQDAINTIRQAALVHDLGKLGSAAQILQKPEDDLSDTELLLVMNHPMDGAELLESFPDLQHLAPIVRAHHEEFDGNGFPHGLKGDEIPLAARIVGLANRYHEQASPKRSGPGRDPSAVQTEFVENAGKGWDPNVVQAFIHAVLTGKIPSKF